MNIKLICVGGIKEEFYKKAVEEYLKRLSRYVKLEVLEVKDEKTPAKASMLEEEKIKETEAQRILSKLKDNAYIIILDIEGSKDDSEEFAKKISKIEEESKGTAYFIIGGSLGLSKNLKQAASMKISFSDMTFPHQLMRVIFLEQLYRAYRIINNEPYHK